MGQNNRYPGRTIDMAIDQMTVRPEPIGLTAQELDLEHKRVVRADRPIPVRAFVRFAEATIRPRAEVIAWTDKAVQVRFSMMGGVEKTVWVWANAVERLDERSRPT